MSKTEEQVLTIEDFKAHLELSLQEIIHEKMEQEVIELAENNEETQIEEAISLVTKAMGLIKNDEVKGLMCALMLTTLPIQMQKELSCLHKELIDKTLSFQLV